MKLVLTKGIHGRILDIGGGGEGVIGRLYSDQVTAIDKCREELDEAPDGFEKVQMDATQLQFEDDSFDNVTFFYALMYMQRDEQCKALNEAARVLKQGGSMYIWDTEVSAAYPEPFCTELDIVLPETQIHTTYGVVKQDNQTAKSIEKMCLAAGLIHVSEKVDCGHFYFHYRKEQL